MWSSVRCIRALDRLLLPPLPVDVPVDGMTLDPLSLTSQPWHLTAQTLDLVTRGSWKSGAEFPGVVKAC